MKQKMCALSVDLDPLGAYYHIHGLGEAPASLKTTILRKALPRFEELLQELGVPATFFVVGQDVETNEEAQAILKRMVEQGHELGNHTYSHAYEICRMADLEVEGEIQKAHEVISRIVGEAHAPIGFRAPGYTINANLLQVLMRLNYAYDSSMFPSPPYYLAKLAVMGGMVLRGRTSGAVVSDPRSLFSPPNPYRPDETAPWRRGHAPIWELPVAVLPLTRLPAIGTFLAAGPSWLRRYLLDSMQRRDFFNLELHGIDLADAIADRIPTELAGRQPDLRIPFTEKRRRFVEAIEGLKQNYEFVTLKEAAERFSQTA